MDGDPVLGERRSRCRSYSCPAALETSDGDINTDEVTSMIATESAGWPQASRVAAGLLILQGLMVALLLGGLGVYFFLNGPINLSWGDGTDPPNTPSLRLRAAGLVVAAGLIGAMLVIAAVALVRSRGVYRRFLDVPCLVFGALFNLGFAILDQQLLVLPRGLGFLVGGFLIVMCLRRAWVLSRT